MKIILISLFALLIALEKISGWKKEEQCSEIQEILYKDLISGLLDSPNAVNISKEFDVGRLVYWLSGLNTQLPGDFNNLIIQRLLQSSQNYSSLQRLPILQENFIETSEGNRTLNMAVLLLKLLHKERKLLSKELLGQYQDQLLKVILHDIENRNMINSTIVFESFELVLEHYMNKKSNELEKLKPLLTTIMEAAMNHLQNEDSYDLLVTCKNFLVFEIKYNKQLMKFLPSNFCLKVWKSLSSKVSVANLTSLEDWISLFSIVTFYDFQTILQDLYISTNSNLNASTNLEILNNIMKIWKTVLLVELKKGKEFNYRNRFLETLFQAITVFVSTGNKTCNNVKENVMLPILDFLICIARNNTICKYSTDLLELCFLSITAEFVWMLPDKIAMCGAQLVLLQYLMKYRSFELLGSIPTLLQCHKRLAAVIASHAHVQDADNQIAEAARNLERLTNSFKGDKSHFSDVAPYMIADILHQFENYSFRPEIKLHYTNCVYALLDLCNEEELAFLFRILTPASHQLLTNFHSDYKKFYRFTGKI